MSLYHDFDLASIHLHDLTVSYKKHPAIHHITANLSLGVATAIIGPNGAGKSTILKAMMGFLKADSGKIYLPFNAQEIAYLPQQSEIDRSLPLTVAELVSTGLYPRVGMFSSMAKWFPSSSPQTQSLSHKVEVTLAKVGLQGFANRSLNSLSNGQFQRALFARIILQDAKLILLDEPFNAVDAKTTLDLCHLIKNWCISGVTVIAVVHDFHLAKNYFTHSMVIARELVAIGSTSEVLNDENIEKAYNTLLYWIEDAPFCVIQEDETQAEMHHLSDQISENNEH